MTLTTLFGSAPVVTSQRELDDIRGMLCAVEFGSQELLGFGRTWEDVLSDVSAKGNAGRQFYRYAMPEERLSFKELTKQLRELDEGRKDHGIPNGSSD